MSLYHGSIKKPFLWPLCEYGATSEVRRIMFKQLQKPALTKPCLWSASVMMLLWALLTPSCTLIQHEPELYISRSFPRTSFSSAPSTITTGLSRWCAKPRTFQLCRAVFFFLSHHRNIQIIYNHAERGPEKRPKVSGSWEKLLRDASVGICSWPNR